MVSFVVVLTATTYLLLLWGDNQPVLWALNFQHANVHVWHRASVQYRWPVANKKRALLSSASVVLFASDVVRYRKFLLAIDSFLQMFGRHSNSQTFFLVDIFLTRRLSKSLVFCEFASVYFESRFLGNSSRISSSWNEWNDCSAILYSLPK